MLRSHVLACTLLTLLALLRGALQDDRATAREAAGPLPPLAQPREILREEFFALELAETPPRVVGYAAWRRRREEPGQQVEWDLHFTPDDTRVLHVERLDAGGGNLVWREWRPGSGRTLSVAWESGAQALECVEWGRAQALRSRIEAPQGAVMPLYLLELARRGDLDRGTFNLFDPLARSLEPVHATTSYATRGAAGAKLAGQAEPVLERTVEFTRDDGTRAGAYTFCGDDLVRFRWQDGTLSARRIEAGEYSAALAECAARESSATVRAR
jgi:hypothetical protein